MSNPYDPNNPGDQSGYGQPAPGYGQQPYPQPGYPAAGGYGYPLAGKPDNNLVWAILCTVLCCLPLGIVAIVKSTSVDKLWATGDYAGAQNAADEAKRWAMWGAIIGVTVTVLSIIAYIIFVVALVGTASTYTPSYTYTNTYSY
ncbi:hypothetical protein GOARA_056_00300 [Gordonia araii NBRC 100433]|uniref:Interferon-induced transmembrane protein n=1 Tax=Gordonia araii NBRC 100433 TaxID=1073574 RepID=G7H358_9ACTN|nr:CD225/dispanin family protein [Gordonia araii]NNG96402.1 CD225/dispanin family protein [Gordonia araii NBRC 100433]GAB10283.1 hypothetical protein GOARA_056_00300 [Gordonia araii NBRC 100433]